MDWFVALNNTGKILLCYLVLINIITFFSFGLDKYKAVASNRRTPEKTLLLLTIFGGSLGSLLGMKLFRHKTQKFHFFVIAMLSLVIHGFLLFQLVGNDFSLILNTNSEF